ncbi:unnamed protein product [Ranitomeya imitator]|uniref:Uncharacterized protein n=1 Tax=Ranitomeya imitator TaxID=111125 RepID=A0ABN9M0Q5_9NEOB|nr:unnamed protein product [Ranitomeya imitator]
MTNEYFSKLLEIGNTQAVFNYLKSLKPFLDYTKNSTDLIHKDKKVYDALCIFGDQLGVFQKRISKGISKENVAKEPVTPKIDGEGRQSTPAPEPQREDQKRTSWIEDGRRCTGPGHPSEQDRPWKEMFERWNSDSKRARKHPDRCKTYFYARLKAGKRENLHVEEKLTILQYLEAIIIVRKLQRPGVVQHMKIDEWKDRIPKSDHVGITVYEHKTAANQVATVILTKEEESWFDIYFEKIWIEAR